LGHTLQVLRTQPNVRLAVLFGSVSRGDERPDSDVDLLVQFGRDELERLRAFAPRFEQLFAELAISHHFFSLTVTFRFLLALP
jgi:predicted nucleotidyltransferase